MSLQQKEALCCTRGRLDALPEASAISTTTFSSLLVNLAGSTSAGSTREGEESGQVSIDLALALGQPVLLKAISAGHLRAMKLHLA